MYSLQIVTDPAPENPRNWENLGVMLCTRKKYKLGDGVSFPFDDYNSWDEVKARIIKRYKAVVILPLYLYDHSDITISTTPLNCPRDSEQVGFVYTTKRRIREHYGYKKVTKKRLEEATKWLNYEVETYDLFLTGEIYGWQILDENNNIVNACFGYFSKSEAKQLGEQELCALQQSSSSSSS